ncbi:hypothetical protein NDU88_011702, partial [Pleurodeles waltl]
LCPPHQSVPSSPVFTLINSLCPLLPVCALLTRLCPLHLADFSHPCPSLPPLLPPDLCCALFSTLNFPVTHRLYPPLLPL